MDISQLRALYDQDQRIAIEYTDMQREVAPPVVRYIDASEMRRGLISYSQLEETNADEVIHAQIEYFESLGQNFEWKLYDYDRPADLKDRLQAHGFAIEEEEAILVLDMEQAPAFFWQPVTHQIQRITDPAQLTDVQTVQQQVWNEDFTWLIAYLAETLSRHPDQMSVYVAYVNDRPASAAWTYFPQHSQFASLWGGSTISDFRKQGLYSALLAVRAQEARARGVKYLTVDASPMSRPILEKFGFQLIAYSHPCQWRIKPRE
jgi:hypothetical protein